MSGRRFSFISIAGVVFLAVAAIAQTKDLFQRGENLFLGKLPLEGKPRGHRYSLPTETVRCVNCHASGKLKLDRAMLMDIRQRRGGPPSAYDETKFCKLLRTGVDPVYVVVDHAMPVYDMPDGDCDALWAYLTQLEKVHADR